MALRAAEYGRTVVVLTIDPAKRLAQALGIKDLGNTPQRVPLAPEVTGELHAMMLDMRRTFDEMVHAVLRRRTRRGDSGEPVLPNRRHVAGGHAGVHGHGEARPAARRGQVGSRRRRHPAVAQRARLPRRAEAARQLHGQPAVASAAGAGARHRQAGDRRGRPGHEGAVDRPGFPDALRRSGFRAGAGFDVRRVPREGRPHLRVAEATGHPVRRRLGRRAGRAAGGVVLRRPAVAARRCRSPG